MMSSPAFGGPEPLLLLLVALALDAHLGWLAPFLPPGPATLTARLAAILDRKLNRQERGDTTRLVRGLLVVLVFVAGALATGAIIHLASQTLPHGWSLELVTLLCCLQGRGPWQQIRTVRRALDHRGLDAARIEIRTLTRRDPDALDEHGIARAAIEAAAGHLNQGVVAPAFWYILLGLPGVLLWTAVNALDRIIGQRTPRYEQFGLTAARLDDALNYLPARLAAGLSPAETASMTKNVAVNSHCRLSRPAATPISSRSGRSTK